MWNFDYCSTGAISALLNENGLSMTKRFGQNFLVSSSALEKIAGLSGAKAGTKVWEIGPGIGALTSCLIKTGADVTAFEIDHGFCRILSEKAFHDTPNFTLIEGDVLKTWENEFSAGKAPDVICANLPYNVGSVLIASLIEKRCIPELMVFTLQSEVVRRICAKTGDNQYSGFSILTAMDYDSTEVMKLKPGCFWPAPNVDSSVVVMKKKTQSIVEEDLADQFISLVRILFSQRRKTIKNNLRTLYASATVEQILAKCKLSGLERAETLSPEEIRKLALTLRSHLKHQSISHPV